MIGMQLVKELKKLDKGNSMDLQEYREAKRLVAERLNKLVEADGITKDVIYKAMENFAKVNRGKKIKLVPREDSVYFVAKDPYGKDTNYILKYEKDTVKVYLEQRTKTNTIRITDFINKYLKNESEGNPLEETTTNFSTKKLEAAYKTLTTELAKFLKNQERLRDKLISDAVTSDDYKESDAAMDFDSWIEDRARKQGVDDMVAYTDVLLGKWI